VEAAGGRPVIEFGTRRAHTPEAGVLGARAAYIGGCAGTSNTLAGFRYGIPVMGTAAHSWVMSFPGETDAFRKLQKVLGDATVQLHRYLRHAGRRAPRRRSRPARCGACASIAAIFRRALAPGARHPRRGRPARCQDHGERRPRRIPHPRPGRRGAPIDAFGVGTQLSPPPPTRPRSALSTKWWSSKSAASSASPPSTATDKISIPGAKQIFRDVARDVVARSGECGKGEALLRPVILGGRLVEPLPTLEQARRRAARIHGEARRALRQLEVAEPWPVIYSRELRAP
jgi:nicotinate phosphoribosyltransferase